MYQTLFNTQKSSWVFVEPAGGLWIEGPAAAPLLPLCLGRSHARKPAMTGNGEDATYKMTYKKWWYPVMTYKNGDDLGLITFPKSTLIVARTCN